MYYSLISTYRLLLLLALLLICSNPSHGSEVRSSYHYPPQRIPAENEKITQVGVSSTAMSSNDGKPAVNKLRRNATTERTMINKAPDTAKHFYFVNTSAIHNDCDALIRPIFLRRQECNSEHSKHTIHLCVDFHDEFDYLLPFLVHHLLLGVEMIWIFDYSIQPWYHHPSILCLVAHDLVHIQAWRHRNEGDILKARRHCTAGFAERAVLTHHHNRTSWAAALTIHDFLLISPEEHPRGGSSSQFVCFNRYIVRFGSSLAGLVAPVVVFPSTTTSSATTDPWPPLLYTHRLPNYNGMMYFMRTGCMHGWMDASTPILSESCPFPEGIRNPFNKIHRIAKDQRGKQAINLQQSLARFQVNRYGGEPRAAAGVSGKEIAGTIGTAWVEDALYRLRLAPVILQLMQDCHDCFRLQDYFQ